MIIDSSTISHNSPHHLSAHVLITSFRRFAPNVSEVSEEFQRLAIRFENAVLPDYAALCYLGASKCERALNSPVCEVHLLLKAARAFKSADIDNLCTRSNGHENKQGALYCYNQALVQCNDDAVMKAAIIRELKKIHPNCDQTSDFTSPAHRAHELEMDANRCIRCNDYETALDKFTEIHDDIVERKTQSIYRHLLQAHELTRILLMLVLDLPPARQSPFNVKLLEKFQQYDECSATADSCGHSKLIMSLFQSLIDECKRKSYTQIVEREIPLLVNWPGLNECQQLLLQKLKEKCIRLQ